MKSENQIVYRIIKCSFGPLVRKVWARRAEGLENVPIAGPAIIACNHASYLDGVLVAALVARQICFLAGEFLFEKPLISWGVRSMGFVQVNRCKSVNLSSLKQSLSVLEEGRLLGVFPEGERSYDGKLQMAKNGIGLLAHLSEVPVIPVAVSGSHGAWPRGTMIPRPRPCLIRFGKPLSFSKAAYRQDRSQVKHSTQEIMNAIAYLDEIEHANESISINSSSSPFL